MKLRATINIDINAPDYREAAKIQERLDNLCAQLAEEYENVKIDLRERREQRGRGVRSTDRGSGN